MKKTLWASYGYTCQILEKYLRGLTPTDRNGNEIPYPQKEDGFWFSCAPECLGGSPRSIDTANDSPDPSSSPESWAEVKQIFEEAKALHGFASFTRLWGPPSSPGQTNKLFELTGLSEKWADEHITSPPLFYYDAMRYLQENGWIIYGI